MGSFNTVISELPVVSAKPTLQDAIAATERAKNNRRLLHELVTSDLFEMADGRVRAAEGEAEKLDMRARLLEAGHVLDEAQQTLRALTSEQP